MDTTRIRPIAVCLFRNENRILVSEGFDTVKQYYYYRPLGGGIEYGESSREAIVREIQEELGARVENLQLLGVLENIFVYEGQLGHEIVFVLTRSSRTSRCMNWTKLMVTSKKQTLNLKRNGIY
jgi:8-oxo-dGTP pyrophosphatase MutT (NUDIX family)